MSEGKFFESPLCKSGLRCRQCRRSRAYRGALAKQFDDIVGDDFACPFGKTEEDFPQDVEPSPFQQAKGLLKTIASEVKGEGGDFSVEERLKTCRGCEFFIKKSGRCAKCGCFMKFKTKLRAGKCPIGKW